MAITPFCGLYRGFLIQLLALINYAVFTAQEGRKIDRNIISIKT